MQRSYDLKLPRFVRIPQLRPNLVLVGSLLWAVLYGWLGYRLWLDGLWVGLRLNVLLTLSLVVIGVFIVLAWRQIGTRWLSGLRGGGKWGALSLREIQAMDPFAFEEYVAQRLFARQGYRVTNTQDSKDGGIDVLVTNRYGEQAVVQCKRYRATVGAGTVRELYGTMIHTGAARAFLVTSSTISEDARRWAADKPITLIDGKRLVELTRAAPGLAKF